MKEYVRVWAEINLDAICYNLKEIKRRIPRKTKLMEVIKADGYGHGAVPIALATDKLVDAYGVATIEEGVELREAGIKKPILILGFTHPSDYPLLVEYDIMASIFRYDMAEELSKEAIKQNKTAYIHIKVDTGMNRIGFFPTDESIEIIKKIHKLDGIQIEGCFTHFAKADEAAKDFTDLQKKRYTDFIQKLEDCGIFIPTKHISNSAGIIDLPESSMDMVRSGIATYGLYPSDEVNRNHLTLIPAMEVKARISYLKEVEKGNGISYGGTYITDKKTKVATIPVGYGDGYPRALSNKGYVLLHGRKARILGRVCMDQFMIDVTGIEGVKENDLVTLIGKEKETMLSAEDITSVSGLFHYELVCNMGKRIPRVYYYKGKKVGALDFYHCQDAVYELSELRKALE